MDRKKQILNAIINKNCNELVFQESYEDILVEITDDLLKNNDFVPCSVLNRSLFLYTSGSDFIPLDEEQAKRNRIIKPIKTKVEARISEKLISLIKTNEVDLFNDFFRVLYKNEEDYKDLLFTYDDNIFIELISYIISNDDLELLFDIFKYLNDNFNVDYNEPIEKIFIYFMENRDNRFYPQFKKELVIWFNEFVFDGTPLDIFYERNFLDLIVKYDVELTADILEQSLHITNDQTEDMNIIDMLLEYSNFFDTSIENTKRKNIYEALNKFASKYPSSESMSLLLFFSIIQNVNEPIKIFKKIKTKNLKNEVINLICKKYLNPRLIRLDLKNRKKIVDFLLDQNLDFDFELKILEAFISNQTTLTLQKDIFNLSDYIRKLYHAMIEGINRNSVEKSIKNDLKSLLLIIIRLYDNNFDIENHKLFTKICNYLFNFTPQRYYSMYNYFDSIDLSYSEFAKTGITSGPSFHDLKYEKYDTSIKKDYFTFKIFHKIFFKLNKISDNNNELKKYVDLIHKLYSSLFVYTRNVIFINSAVEKKDEITKARVEERNRILANLSHTVKNMIGTIIDPLENMKSQNKLQPVAIDNAIRGANLVRGLVNAMNLSFKGSIEDFQYDIKNAEYNNSTSLKQMFIESLKYSISSMFDGKYFEKFMRNYFPNKAEFLVAKTKWNDVSQTTEIQKIMDFMNTYMLKAEIDLDSAQDFVIGNDKGSSLKFLIMIQEMVFNAVKYSSFVPQDERFIKIEFSADNEYVSIQVSNKFQPKTKVKSSGLGHEIINNFSKLLQTKPDIRTENEIYSVEVKFQNLWEV
ncbi:MAG: hypothetical protein K9N09_02570 [Candidatus Cloacimonetes bacterium]|nr:hypothetical protein [Candidatus Cloacimonadota bacterium]MCF7813111.1 hypothetical protein [Candidatus Cloacimonadota bacterium]MCF7867559.1 hypothetical protein [Candidatus Cloacimonadota bacterium]MCF7883047.1 hypothetical protein [Candidatus Cloacimonadota bacterium]